MKPFKNNLLNNFTKDLVLPNTDLVSIHFDSNVEVYHTGNDHYLVYDTKEKIQFCFKKGELFTDLILENDGFCDEKYYEKLCNYNGINYQDKEQLTEMPKDSLYYIDSLFNNLERIILHVSTCYSEFLENKPRLKNYEISNTKPLLTGQDPLVYSGNEIQTNDSKIVEPILLFGEKINDDIKIYDKQGYFEVIDRKSTLSFIINDNTNRASIISESKNLKDDDFFTLLKSEGRIDEDVDKFNYYYKYLLISEIKRILNHINRYYKFEIDNSLPF